MTPSERRLHPLSFLFVIGGQLQQLIVPALLILLGARSAGVDNQVWFAVLVIPYALVAILRSLSFRYRFDEHELVIRSGFIFRNVRHVPYARIQNIDAIQGIGHRLLSVVDVRIETGGGDQVEARMRVLPIAALDEMRARVFAGRADRQVDGGPANAQAVSDRRDLLTLQPRELLLAGFVDNRGMVIVGAAFGLLWEFGLFDSAMEAVIGETPSGRGIFRQIVWSLFGSGVPQLGRLTFMAGSFVALLLAIRVLSMGWSLVRLYGFRLEREGDDLRAQFGLFTRVIATIPLQRIQTLTVREGPLHRMFQVASVRVDSAGGDAAEVTQARRESLAPIIRRDALTPLLAGVLPEIELKKVAWQPVDPRAFRRAFKASLAFAAFITLPFAGMLRWWVFGLLALMTVWAYFHARFYVKNLGWALANRAASTQAAEAAGIDEPGSASPQSAAILFRSGWIWKEVSIARFTKVQVVTLNQSPFDRRTRMARVRVDTAGAGDLSHRVDIPYLGLDTARALHARLSAAAARTAFRW